MPWEVAAVVLAAVAVEQGHEASVAQRNANRQQRRMQAAQNARARREALRTQMVQQAQIAAGAANTGTTGSSGALGGVAAVGAQTSSAIGFQQTLEMLNNKRLGSLEAAAKHEDNAQMASGLSSMAGNYGSDISAMFK